MRKYVYVGVAASALLLLFGGYLFCTIPPIEQYGARLAYVGGNWSDADVCYYDYRPVISGTSHHTDVWCGDTASGEFRRLEWRDLKIQRSGTTAVLRDVASNWSHTGVSRGGVSANQLQAQYNAVLQDHNDQQWLRDRVWRWRVHEFR